MKSEGGKPKEQQYFKRESKMLALTSCMEKPRALDTVIAMFEKIAHKTEGMVDFIDELVALRDFRIMGEIKDVSMDRHSEFFESRSTKIAARKETRHRPEVKLTGFEEHFLDHGKINELYRSTLPDGWWDSAHIGEVALSQDNAGYVVSTNCKVSDNGLTKIEIKAGHDFFAEDCRAVLDDLMVRNLIFLNGPLHAKPDQSEEKDAPEIRSAIIKNFDYNYLPELYGWFAFRHLGQCEVNQSLLRDDQVAQERVFVYLVHRALKFDNANIYNWEDWETYFADHLVKNAWYEQTRNAQAKILSRLLRKYFEIQDHKFEPWVAARRRDILIDEIVQPVKLFECGKIINKIPDFELAEKLTNYLFLEESDLPRKVVRYQEFLADLELPGSNKAQKAFDEFFIKYQLPDELKKAIKYLVLGIIESKFIINSDKEWVSSYLQEKVNYFSTHWLSMTPEEQDIYSQILHRFVTEALTTVPESYG